MSAGIYACKLESSPWFCDKELDHVTAKFGLLWKSALTWSANPTTVLSPNKSTVWLSGFAMTFWMNDGFKNCAAEIVVPSMKWPTVVVVSFTVVGVGFILDWTGAPSVNCCVLGNDVFEFGWAMTFVFFEAGTLDVVTMPDTSPEKELFVIVEMNWPTLPDGTTELYCTPLKRKKRSKYRCHSNLIRYSSSFIFFRK